METPRTIVRDAAIVLALSAAAAAAVNAIRPDGLPWVADRAYETLVPCPEPLGEVDPVEPGDPAVADARTLLIDARGDADRRAWSHPRAVAVPFDWLDPVPDDRVQELIRTRARRVVVYGDGGDPDSGRELARELAGRGMRNVGFVPGGADALRRSAAPNAGEGGAR